MAQPVRQFLLSFVVQHNVPVPLSAALQPRHITRTVTGEYPPTARQVAALEAKLTKELLHRSEALVQEVKLLHVSELHIPQVRAAELGAPVVYSTENGHSYVE